MLFNSYLFILVFLPAVILGVYLCQKNPLRTQRCLLLFSAVFYGFAGWQNLLMITASILLNHRLARGLRSASQPRNFLLTLGISGNLLLLGYFKYRNFFLENSAFFFPGLFSLENLPKLILPVGISFFTFQQIAFLVDTWQGEKTDYPLPQYALFVTFFPQLVAGPILHHRQLIPQLEACRVTAAGLAAGLSLFILGLAKKVLLADSLAPVAEAVFDSASPQAFSASASALGILAYTFQLYFDFSGYCDMAAGMALAIGIRLAPNFNSPYQASSILDFWRRWHMTLSAFLRDYVYIPLGGNRKGPARRQFNLLLTMLIGGFWHGAAWPFVLWGGIHGVLLSIDHAWQRHKPFSLPRPLAVALTFCAVAVTWVFFRAPSFDAALALLANLAQDGIQVRQAIHSLSPDATILFWGGFVAAPLIAFLSPTALRIFGLQGGSPTPRFAFAPSLSWALVLAFSFFLSMLALSRVVKFLYFQF